MLLVISPAKKLDFSPVEIENNLSKPLFQKDATNLANVASKLSKSELKQLMSISDKLADLNFQRFQSFKNNPTFKFLDNKGYKIVWKKEYSYIFS